MTTRAINIARVVNLHPKEITMKSKLAALATLALVGAISLPSFAADAAAASAQKMYALKDGGTLYVFGDGKMAQAGKFWRTVYLKPGQSIETADGQKLIASSNEVARLGLLLNQGHH
jgi:streptogramin lyase